MSEAVKRADLERLAQYRDQLCAHPRLTYLFFELTDACNLACLHCGSSACPQNSTYLPLQAIQKVLDEVAAAYPPQSVMVCLSGGEPLLHPDFFDVAAYAHRLGFPCGMTTNGTRIDAACAQRLVQTGVASVSVSLDGPQALHDWLRGRPGVYDQAVAGLRQLVETSHGQMLTQVTTVAHKKNLHHLEELYPAVCALGVTSWRIINLEPIGRARTRNDLLLDAEELRFLLDYIQAKRFDPAAPVEVTYGCSHFLTLPYERMVRDNYFLCGAGTMVASVLCNGDIYGCMDIERRPELVQGNVFHDSFVNVWEHGFQPLRRDRSEDNEACRQCADRRYCRGDAAHTWDYDAKRPLLCMKQLFASCK